MEFGAFGMRVGLRPVIDSRVFIRTWDGNRINELHTSEDLMDLPWRRYDGVFIKRIINLTYIKSFSDCSNFFFSFLLYLPALVLRCHSGIKDPRTAILASAKHHDVLYYPHNPTLAGCRSIYGISPCYIYRYTN